MTEPEVPEGGRLAGSTVMTKEGPKSLSFSQVSAYARCPEQYRLKFLDQVPQDSLGAGLAGIAFHDVAEEAERWGWWKDRGDGWPYIDEMLQAWAIRAGFLMDSWGGEQNILWTGRKSKRYPMGENLEWWCFNIRTMFLKYASIRRRDAGLGLVTTKADIERYVSVYLPTELNPEGKDETNITGRIDITLLVSEDGEGIIRDWKTGSMTDPQQLAFYAWMLKKAGKPTFTRGQIAYLRGSWEKGTLLKEYDLTLWMPLVPRLLQDAAAGIARKVFPMHPSNLCGSCMVKAHCAWGQTLPEKELQEDHYAR